MKSIREASNDDSAAIAALLTELGYSTGAVLGALFPHERWKRVRLKE
jgi:N-acetylglutamate synthase-like GNAT family acetyltransferase